VPEASRRAHVMRPSARLYQPWKVRRGSQFMIAVADGEESLARTCRCAQSF
jgi:hypothetical protein